MTRQATHNCPKVLHATDPLDAAAAPQLQDVAQTRPTASCKHSRQCCAASFCGFGMLKRYEQCGQPTKRNCRVCSTRLVLTAPQNTHGGSTSRIPRASAGPVSDSKDDWIRASIPPPLLLTTSVETACAADSKIRASTAVSERADHIRDSC